MKDDFANLAIHTMTTRPWSLREACEGFSSRGVGGISVWVEALEGLSDTEAKSLIEDSGLSVPALVRGGFLCAPTAELRRKRIDENLRLIQTAQELKAEMLVLVVGAVPGEPLSMQRGWVQDGISEILEAARQARVKIAIEPLHPMYAADRSCINRMAEARRICENLAHPAVGIAVDVYHVWWDPDLEAEIALAGKQDLLFGFHLCDWRSPTRDLLNDRALMGDGCIDIRGIRGMMVQAGYEGWEEVEIFSEEHWARNQGEFVDDILVSYEETLGARA